MSTQGKLRYAVDILIGIAFILSALSGIVLYFAPSGYQGGRNPYYLGTVLFLSTHDWDTVHVWGSFAMIAGVGAHLALHLNWMILTTKKLLFRRKRVPRPEPVTVPAD
jgi:hypothetical protein